VTWKPTNNSSKLRVKTGNSFSIFTSWCQLVLANNILSNDNTFLEAWRVMALVAILEYRKFWNPLQISPIGWEMSFQLWRHRRRKKPCLVVVLIKSLLSDHYTFLNSIISCSCECVFSAHISFIDKHPLFLALIILSSWPLLYIYLLHGWPCFDPRGYFKNGFSSFFYWKRENDLVNKREAKGLWITRQKQKHERQVQAKRTLLIKPVLVARLSERRLSKLLGKKWYYYQWCS